MNQNPFAQQQNPNWGGWGTEQGMFPGMNIQAMVPNEGNQAAPIPGGGQPQFNPGMGSPYYGGFQYNPNS